MGSECMAFGSVRLHSFSDGQRRRAVAVRRMILCADGTVVRFQLPVVWLRGRSLRRARLRNDRVRAHRCVPDVPPRATQGREQGRRADRDPPTAERGGLQVSVREDATTQDRPLVGPWSVPALPRDDGARGARRHVGLTSWFCHKAGLAMKPKRTTRQPSFFVRPGVDPKSGRRHTAAALADDIADFLIRDMNEWRRKHGLPPMPEE